MGKNTGTVWRVLMLLALGACSQSVVIGGSPQGSGGSTSSGAAGGMAECAGDAACDDGNVCTVNACVEGTCSEDNVPDGTLCATGTCQSGECVATRLFHRTKDGLYATVLDGQSATVQLSPTLAGGYVAHRFALSNDGRYVVYAADVADAGMLELYATAVDGTAHIKLNGPLVPGGYGASSRFVISADGSRCVYVADETNGVGMELLSVRLDGSDRVLLEEGLVTAFSVTEDNRAVYVVPEPGSSNATLHAVALDGTGHVTLANHSWFNPDTSLLLSANHVVYAANDGGWPTSLYAAKLDGITTTQINPPLLQGMPFDVALTPDGSTAVYRAIVDTLGVWELHATRVDDAIDNKVNAPLPPGGQVVGFQLTADGRAIYLIGQGGYVQRLFAGQLDGTGQIEIGPGPDEGVVSALAVSEDGSQAVYRLAFPVSNEAQLHASATDGSGSVALIDQPSRFQLIDPQGRHIVVLSATDGGMNTTSIHIAEDGSVASIPVFEGGSMLPILVTPDGKQAVVRGPVNEGGSSQLFLANLDGSGAVALGITLPELEWPEVTEDSFMVR